MAKVCRAIGWSGLWGKDGASCCRYFHTSASGISNVDATDPRCFKVIFKSYIISFTKNSSGINKKHYAFRSFFGFITHNGFSWVCRQVVIEGSEHTPYILKESYCVCSHADIYRSIKLMGCLLLVAVSQQTFNRSIKLNQMGMTSTILYIFSMACMKS